MKGFHKLEKKCPEGIPFSKCKEYLKRNKKTKRRNKKTNTKRKKKRTFKKKHIPPKGVVIRKRNRLYRSNGKSLKPI